MGKTTLSQKSHDILSLIAAGRSYEQILASNLELTYHDISNAAQEALNLLNGGTHKPLHHKQTWLDSEKECLMALYQQGLSSSRIAQELGRSEGSIEAQIIRMRNDQVGEPRVIGNHLSTGAPIEISPGRYGPFLRYEGRTVTLPREYDASSISLDDALGILQIASLRPT